METTPETESAETTPTPSSAASRANTNRPAQHTSTVSSNIRFKANNDESRKARAALESATPKSTSPKSLLTKATIPHTAKLNIPHNSSTAQASPSHIPSRLPAALPPTPASASTCLPESRTALTPTATAKNASKPRTSREYAELAELAFHSFPFATFAAEHSKTEAEVFNTFSAIISLPVFQHSANELRCARLARERMRAFGDGLREVRDRHKAEEKKEREEAGTVSGTEEDRVLTSSGKGVLGAAVTKGPSCG